MSDHELDSLAIRYLEAVAKRDFGEVERIWDIAASDPEIEAMLHGLHASSEADAQAEDLARDSAAITAAVQKHLPTAEIEKDAFGPVTLAAAAEELFRHTPAQLPAAAHVLNETMREVAEPIPAELNLPQFIAWIESLYGTAPRAYWKALYEAAIKLDLKRAEKEYQLATRSAPKPEGPR